MAERIVLQFGTGVFIRGFFDRMIDQLNRAGNSPVRVIGVKPTSSGTLSLADRVHFPYIERGLSCGKIIEQHDVIQCVRRWIHPFEDWSGFLDTAKEDVAAVVSNTTERGLDAPDIPRPTSCPSSYPAQLAAWLYERFERRADLVDDGALTLLPLELLEDNGDLLRSRVEGYAASWELGSGFLHWLSARCDFRSTLVDRIVTKPGPSDDALAVIAEPFSRLVITGGPIPGLPLAEAGLDIVHTESLRPHHRLKVRVLNGGHMMILVLGKLAGLPTVRACMEEPAIATAVETALRSEVAPVLDVAAGDPHEYTDIVLERFRNPFLEHLLESLALNAEKKMDVRILPTISERRARGEDSPALCAVVSAFDGLFGTGLTTTLDGKDRVFANQAREALSRGGVLAMIEECMS